MDQEIVLARSTAGVPLTQGLPAIALTLKEARLLGDDAQAIPMPPAVAWDRGFPAEQKRSGPNDLYLVALAKWLSETRQGNERDISVMVDQRIPFRILVEVLFTAGQSSYSRFHLVVQSDAGPRELVMEAPAPNDPRAGLTIFVVNDGIVIKAPSGNVAPGCGGVGAGITIPRRDGALDAAALGSCLGKVAAAAGQPLAARITANPNVPFAEIVVAIDAVVSVRELGSFTFAVPK